jgi:hypothetical protein
MNASHCLGAGRAAGAARGVRSRSNLCASTSAACSTSRSPSTSRPAFAPQAVLTTSTAKLPASHLESSKRALEQLKASTVNRASLSLFSCVSYCT